MIRAPDDFKNALGKRLASRRRRLGLTLQDVQRETGIDFRQVHKYENGEHHLSAWRLYQFARALRTTVGDLCDVEAVTKEASA